MEVEVEVVEGQMWDGARERKLGIEYGMKREGGGGVYVQP